MKVVTNQIPFFRAGPVCTVGSALQLVFGTSQVDSWVRHILSLVVSYC